MMRLIHFPVAATFGDLDAQSSRADPESSLNIRTHLHLHQQLRSGIHERKKIVFFYLLHCTNGRAMICRRMAQTDGAIVSTTDNSPDGLSS